MRKIKSLIFSPVSIIILLVLVLIVGSVLPQMDTEIVTVTVTEKERVITGSGDSMSSKYLVFTDTETFQVTDSLFHFRWDSSDFYGRLKEGQKIRVQVCGWRVPFMSMYRNMLEVK